MDTDNKKSRVLPKAKGPCEEDVPTPAGIVVDQGSHYVLHYGEKQIQLFRNNTSKPDPPVILEMYGFVFAITIPLMIEGFDKELNLFFSGGFQPVQPENPTTIPGRGRDRSQDIGKNKIESEEINRDESPMQLRDHSRCISNCINEILKDIGLAIKSKLKSENKHRHKSAVELAFHLLCALKDNDQITILLNK